MYTLQSVPAKGFYSHTFTTSDPRLAYALYEEALNIAQADFASAQGLYIIEFIADVPDCHSAIQLALAQGGNA